MCREDIVKLVITTMQYYGSDAGERAQPGSKLKWQAEHIADVIEEYNEAIMLTSRFKHIQISPRV